MKYVKYCPICDRENDEKASACECGHLLSRIGSVPQRKEPAQPVNEPAGPDNGHADDERIPGKEPNKTPKTEGVGDRLYLQFVSGDRCFNLHSGQTLGRDDNTDDPNRVAIPADAGVDVGYVSRRHCRFELRGGVWYVTPINPRDYGSELKEPNPTFLGAELLPADQPHPLRNGDRLRLANVELRVMLFGGAA